MKKIVIQTSLLLLVLFGILINTVLGQADTQTKIDSLKKVIETATNDTTKVNALNDLAKQILYSEPQKAYEYANKALALAQKAKWEKGIANSHHTLGNYHYSQFDYPKALDFWHKALKIYEASGSKTGMAKMLGNIGIFYSNQSDYPKALDYFFKTLNIDGELGNKSGMARTYGHIGVVYQKQSDYPKALNYFFKALKIKEETGDKSGMAINLVTIGHVYARQSDYAKALNYYFKALKINEGTGNKSGIAATLISIGLVYAEQFDYPKALDYYFKALKIDEEIGDKSGMATTLGNIGLIYAEQINYSKALDYYFKALKIDEEIGNNNGIARHLGNIGVVYGQQSNYPKALDYYFKSLKIREEIGDKRGIAINLSNIGSLYAQTGNYLHAEEHLQKALVLSEEIGEIYIKKNTYSYFSELYTKTGRHKEALEMYKKHVELQDSINSEENQKAMVQKEMQFEYEKKTAIDSIAHNKEKEIKDAKIAQQQTEIKAKRNQQYALFGGLFLVIVFAGVMYNRFRLTRKQKVIIEEKERETHEQKVIIEEKHKEITDSINYAERIQRSFLATTEMLDEHLSSPFWGGAEGGGGYFVFFRPKDVVSGDFYWAAKLNNDNFAFACADSTGHGVPGAIMSILNISSLEKSIETQTEPHKILHETRKIIINRLKKDGSAEGGKDGMDCSLLVLNQEKNHLTFASANNSVFIIRNGELLEFNGDKMPVGKHDKADEIFTLHSFDLQKGDVIYSLTDGFPDQFGGSKGKKYMIKNLKNLLLEITLLPLKEQEQKLANEFDKWKGSEDQVDDVCIIGVRI